MRSNPIRVGLLALALTLTVCTSLGAIAIPDAGRPLASKELWLPELDVAAVTTPAAEAAAARQQNLAALGAPVDSAFLDVRTGRWATLLPSQPLIPGDGVGNRLSWADLGMAAPRDEAGFEDRVISALRSYLSAHSDELRIPLEQLGRARITVYPDLIQVHVPQVVAGVPVRGAFLTAVIGHGNLILFGTSEWGDVMIPVAPAISAEEARWAAHNHLAEFRVEGSWKSSELVLMPTDVNGPAGQALGHRLAWAVRPGIAGDLGNWEALVDAHSGELIAFFDTNHYAADTRRVVGGVYPKSNDGDGAQGIEQPGWPMPFADFGSFTTDEGGNLPSPVSGSLTSNLDGPFIRISDNCGGISETATQHLNLGVSGGDDCTTPSGSDSAGNTHSARTGFYELNRIAQWARERTPHGWLSNRLTANMNINSNCNAFWNGSSVNFYRSGGGCGNTGELAGVFDHEWGHGLDDNDTNGSISFPGEGIADIYAALRLDESCIGPGFFDSGNCGGYGDPCLDCTGIRDIDWAQRQSGQPHDVAWGLSNCSSCGFFANVHCLGAIYSETVWDLIKRDIPNNYGNDSNSAMELGTRITLAGAAPVGDWFTCNGNGNDGCGSDGGYLNFLAADDDNGNINDGTPHMTAIASAFDRHGIACNTPAVQDSGCVGQPTSAPVVTTTPGDRQMTLSWDAVPGASNYNVYRAEGVTGCDMGKNFAGQTSNLSLVDTELLNNFDYYYTVVPVGPSGTCMGPASACTTATPAATAPGLSLSGGCPGGTLTSTGNAPNGPVALARGSAGSAVLPGSGCVGMPVNVTGASLDQTGLADGSGTITFTVNTCGVSYASVDYLNCASSNGVSVP